MVMTSKDLNLNVTGFKTVQIGNQLWTASNFNGTKYQNGNDIPEAVTEKQWREAERDKKPVWCYINFCNSAESGNEKLYNWYAAVDRGGLAPLGWRLPTIDDFIKLFFHLGAHRPKNKLIEVLTFNNIGNKLKCRFGWDDFEENGILMSGNGSNESGFNGIPVGIYTDDCEFDGGLDMFFHGKGFLGCWWSSTEDKKYKNEALQCILRQYADYATLTSSPKSDGASIRFIKDTIEI